MRVLIAGGALGLVLTLAAIGFAIWWVKSYYTGGADASQGKPWIIWACIGGGLAGLAIMFGSLQMARSEERSNPILRRLLYGFNAVLTGLLLFGLLVVINILVYIWVPAVSDWTKSGIYSLSSRSKSILENLDEPVKVYAIVSGRDPGGDIQNLMENCQAISNKISVEYLSPHRDQERFAELMRRYQMLGDYGMLVVYGTPPEENYQFIKAEGELFEVDFSGGRAERQIFKGEEALMTAIDYLQSGKSKAIVYFTQGHGELDIEDTGMARGEERGAGLLRERLEKSNYEVKGLKLSALAAADKAGRTVTAKNVPDDASLVVIAGPRLAGSFTLDALGALREYMNPTDPKKKKGKMAVFLDPVVQEGKMVHTGLESFLKDFNVEVGDNRIMSAARIQIVQRGGALRKVAQAPLAILVMANRQLDRNPIANAFEGIAFPMQNARTVRPLSGGAPGRGSFQAETLFTNYDQNVWAEEDLSEPAPLIDALINERLSDLREKLRKAERLPVAVAVSEQGQPDMRDPHAFMRRPPQGNEIPRMVVFGSSGLAANAAIRDGGIVIYSVISSSLAWLRDRPANIGIEAKKRDIYQMDEKTNVSRMIYLPFFLMSIAVVGLGLGVWVVRRR
jgi:hypothetical protein